jgi:hypothetical protein
MGFLDDYEPVEDRLARFWAEHPAGRVLTRLVDCTDEDAIVFSEVYTDREDERPAATGLARERVSDAQVNRKSHLEVAETSAIGRALANLGYAPKGKRPSREEMGGAADGSLTKEQLRAMADAAKWLKPAQAAARIRAATGAKSSAELTQGQYEAAMEAVRAPEAVAALRAD